MRNPFAIIGTIPVSVTATAAGTIPLVRARTVSITVQVTFPAAADADATVKVYYSPDGNNWDTIVFTSWAIAFTASSVVQRTVIVDPPEHGYLMIKILNGSAAKQVLSAKIWYTIQSWDSVSAITDERKYTREREREKMEETGQPRG